jgi:hypothetical protein
MHEPRGTCKERYAAAVAARDEAMYIVRVNLTLLVCPTSSSSLECRTGSRCRQGPRVLTCGVRLVKLQFCYFCYIHMLQFAGVVQVQG